MNKDFAERLAIYSRIASLRRLRDELAPLAVSPSVRCIRYITPHQHATLFELLRTIDALLPGAPAEQTLYRELSAAE